MNSPIDLEVKATGGEVGRNTAADGLNGNVTQLPNRGFKLVLVTAPGPEASDSPSPSTPKKSKYVPMELREPHDENYDPQPYPVKGAVYTPITRKRQLKLADGLPAGTLRTAEEQVCFQWRMKARYT